ncbi:unnamed protein product, partial [Didymodactylos carnosus]
MEFKFLYDGNIFNVIIALHNDKNGLQIKPEQRTRLGNLDMTTDKWALLETIQNVLKLFYGATKIVSGREYATIGAAYYTINVIKECLTDHHTDEHQLNALKKSLTRSERSLAEREIRRLINDICDGANKENNRNIISPNSSTTTRSPPSEQHRKTAINCKRSVFREFLAAAGTTTLQNSRKPTASSSIDNELQIYRSAAMLESTCVLDHEKSQDILKFWLTNSYQLPLLVQLAKQFLSAPATSVPSESCFSIASYLHRKQ